MKKPAVLFQVEALVNEHKISRIPFYIYFTSARNVEMAFYYLLSLGIGGKPRWDGVEIKTSKDFG